MNMEVPPLDVPYSTKTALGQCASGSGWQGMSIKDILEKVDLFNFTTLVDDDAQKKKDTKEYPKMIPDLKVQTVTNKLQSGITLSYIRILGEKYFTKKAFIFYTFLDCKT